MPRQKIGDDLVQRRKNLYSRWYYVVQRPHSKEFDDFSYFYDWAVKAGYCLDEKLVRFDKNKPFSPENCCFVGNDKITSEWAEEWSKRWSTTVGCIRKLCGLPQLEGGENYDEPNL